MKVIILKQRIIHDEFTAYANKMYDVPLSEESVTIVKENIQYPEEWNIGLIYGESGSGKTTLLNNIGEVFSPTWDTNKSIISDLNAESPEKAGEVLSCVGLSSVPAWFRSYNNLSTGQKFRADLAKSILNDNKIILIDEFTSVVDRNVARSASFALQKYIRKNNKQIVLSSCHKDIIEWLQPDWIYNPTEALTHVVKRGSLQRPKIKLSVCRGKYEAWNIFKQHHYLSHDLNKGSKILLFYWGDEVVAINCILSLPHAKLTKAWRESRLVVLPDYQGLGIGVRASNYTGALIRSQGGVYYSKTTHPSMIHYRNQHDDLWRFVGKGRSSPQGSSHTISSWNQHTHRYMHSHEYIGPATSPEEGNLIWNKNNEL